MSKIVVRNRVALGVALLFKMLLIAFFLLYLNPQGYAQWTTDGSGNMSNTNTGKVGIGTSSPQAFLEVHNPAVLSTTAGSSLEMARLSASSGNGSQLRFLLNRFAAGNSWTSASTRIQAWTDVSPQAYIDFNPNNGPSALAFGINNTEYFHMTQTGLIGINTNNPVASFEVHSMGLLGTSAGNSSEMARFYCNTGNGSMLQILANRFAAGNSWTTAGTRVMAVTDGTNQGYIEFNPNGSGGGIGLGSTNGELMRLLPSGSLLIGRTSLVNSGYLLDVNGNARANGVVVNTSGADYVFAPGYHLPTLQEIEAYIDQEHHLPGIPSAAEMQRDGVDLGNNQTKLLAKVEELTLYLIEKDKEVEALKAKIKQLDDLNKTLESLAQRLERLEHSAGSSNK